MFLCFAHVSGTSPVEGVRISEKILIRVCKQTNSMFLGKSCKTKLKVSTSPHQVGDTVFLMLQSLYTFLGEGTPSFKTHLAPK